MTQYFKSDFFQGNHEKDLREEIMLMVLSLKLRLYISQKHRKPQITKVIRGAGKYQVSFLKEKPSFILLFSHVVFSCQIRNSGRNCTQPLAI